MKNEIKKGFRFIVKNAKQIIEEDFVEVIAVYKKTDKVKVKSIKYNHGYTITNISTAWNWIGNYQLEYSK
jgi:hypothetical protein